MRLMRPPQHSAAQHSTATHTHHPPASPSPAQHSPPPAQPSPASPSTTQPIPAQSPPAQHSPALGGSPARWGRGWGGVERQRQRRTRRTRRTPVGASQGLPYTIYRRAPPLLRPYTRYERTGSLKSLRPPPNGRQNGGDSKMDLCVPGRGRKLWGSAAPGGGAGGTGGEPHGERVSQPKQRGAYSTTSKRPSCSGGCDSRVPHANNAGLRALGGFRSMLGGFTNITV